MRMPVVFWYLESRCKQNLGFVVNKTFPYTTISTIVWNFFFTSFIHYIYFILIYYRLLFVFVLIYTYVMEAYRGSSDRII